MSLDVVALAAWTVISLAFIVVVILLYTKVSKSKKIDESSDETSAY